MVVIRRSNGRFGLPCLSIEPAGSAVRHLKMTDSEFVARPAC